MRARDRVLWIAAGGLYGLEQIGDVQALILELVEGDTLADRIGNRGSGLGIRGHTLRSHEQGRRH